MHKNRALLLDRDRFTFMPDLFPFLRSARDRGYRLAVLTNQAGVARGYFSQQDYQRVNAHMLGCLRREQIEIELSLCCFEHPDGVVSDLARDSFWRKPNPGMVLEVVRRLDLDPARSVFLGDAWRDMQAAQSGGIGKCLWLAPEKTEAPEGIVLVKDFAQALTALSA